MTKIATRKAEAKLARLEETLTFIRTQYTVVQKEHAADFIMELEGQRAYLSALLEG